MLVAIVLPAVQSAREAARRTTCENNLKQVGIAIRGFESRHHALPIGSRSYLASGVSWWVDLLPDLEEMALYQQLNLQTLNAGNPSLSVTNGAVINGDILPVMRCPSSIIPSLWTVALTEYQVCLPSYVGVAGTTDDPGLDEPRKTACCVGALDGQISAGGVFTTNTAIRLCQVLDGFSKTICVGEASDYAVDSIGRQRNIDAGYPLGWMVGTTGVGTPPNFRNSNPSLPAPSAWNIVTVKYLPNTRTFELPGVKDSPHGPNNPFSSRHLGGVLVLFLDGSVQLVPDTFDLLILRQLVTRDDGSSASL